MPRPPQGRDADRAGDFFCAGTQPLAYHGMRVHLRIPRRRGVTRSIAHFPILLDPCLSEAGMRFKLIAGAPCLMNLPPFIS